MAVLRPLLDDILDGLLPCICLLCRAQTEGGGLCRPCRADLPRNHPACPRCAAYAIDTTRACGRCQARPPNFTRLVAPLRYEFPVDALLTRLKFGRELALAEPLGSLIGTAVSGTDVDIVVPLPLHWRRLLVRGFNQAERLAAAVAAHLDRPIHRRALDRCRATRPQTSLDKRARQSNVAGAFRARADAVSGRRVLLVDDVVTSAATVSAASAALYRAGAKEVVVAALARA